MGCANERPAPTPLPPVGTPSRPCLGDTHSRTHTHALPLVDAQPYLKPHNLRTYEDFNKPVPNYRSMALKAGEVPRFFDTVLSSRANDAVAQVLLRACGAAAHKRTHAAHAHATARPAQRKAGPTPGLILLANRTLLNGPPGSPLHPRRRTRGGRSARARQRRR